MSDNKDFKPYIPASKVTPELTATSIILGMILAVVFGAANAYLGLRVGMTVSASIPAAVISMAVIRVIMKKDSILESNLVQTIGSAGESLAAGAIFTLPVLFLWAKEGVTQSPSMLTIFLIALCGGILGVLFMIPLRNALIVKEHGVIPYPEGMACSEVLLAGEEGGSGAKYVFIGMGAAAVIKFLVDGLKCAASVITIPITALKTQFSLEVYPALVGVGYICGARITSFMFAGGILGWFVLIPAIVIFGAETILYPGTAPIAEMYAAGGASAIWSSYIRYIGAGALAAAGIISLIKTLPLIITTFKASMSSLKGKRDGEVPRTDRDLSSKVILIGVIAVILVVWFLPEIPVGFVGALLVAVCGFFFATVSARMVGIVGSSNNPVSGMAIASLLLTVAILKVTMGNNAAGMTGAIAIGSIICIISAIAGDTSQDLKTGYILGATPKKQQIGELIGVVASAAAIGGVLILLDTAWGFGSAQIAAPQATLMKLIVEGVMGGNLPWGLIGIGAFIPVVVELLGIPALPIAIGLYLPLELTATIMTGGILRLIVDKKKKKAGEKESGDSGSGILFCSGMIAGEGLVGILLALLAVIGVDKAMDLSGVFNTGIIGGIVLLVLLIVMVYVFAAKKEKK